MATPPADEPDAHRLDAQLLSDLWIFRAAARLGSVTRAAEQLGVTQGAVSQRVLRLEGRLGAPLFLRAKGRMVLTEAGQNLLETMTQVALLLNDSLSRVNRVQRNAIVVSCIPSLAMEWLVGHLEDFYQAHPGIEVFVRAEMAASTIDRMDQHGIDVCIDYEPDPTSDLHQLALVRELTLPVCSRGYREARLDGGPEAASGVTLLHDDAPWWGAPADYEWTTWRAGSGLDWPGRPAGARHFNLSHLAYHAAMTGQGVALGRSIMVNRLMAHGDLVAAVDAPPAPGSFYRVLTHRPGDARSPVRRFGKWCGEAMAQTQRETLGLLGRAP
ncbi:LysR substrate-binding domain-containing protein [Caulobacter sp. KR2-114]|uniref:LysR substrate-binding domain-containing protein n=1 Tax=Caulobacter sp. KR2-114 TaxID=3400912 RepID=UPI003C10AF85